ncbi:MAG: histidinol-phosphate transaminase [Bacteroidota bacterium]
MNRRNWLQKTTGVGIASLIATPTIATTLTQEEITKFNPRALEDVVRLSSNENPYGPSKVVREAMIAAFDNSCRYPYSYADELIAMIAEKEGVGQNHIVLVGGSTEGLKITGITFTEGGGEIIAGRPTFLSMMTYAKQWGAEVNWVDVDENQVYDVNEIEKRISNKTKLVFLCNPNNPTSTLLPAEQLVDFCSTAAKKTVVFSDEAYYDYITEPNYPSMVDLVKKGEDVIVSRTFSKVYGLAGLRIGYLIAKPSIANKLKSRVVAFTNVVAIKAAVAAMKDDEFYQFSLEKTNEGKKLMTETFDDMGLEYLPSHTNFLFFKTGMEISKFQEKMRAHGVNVGRPFPPFRNWCRISTGTIPEVERFNAGVRSVLG